MSKEFELANYIVRLKEERDLKVQLAKNYAKGLEKLYNDEIDGLEKMYNELCHKNS